MLVRMRSVGKWYHNLGCKLEVFPDMDARKIRTEVSWHTPDGYHVEKYADFAEAVDRYYELEKKLTGMYKEY